MGKINRQALRRVGWIVIVLGLAGCKAKEPGVDDGKQALGELLDGVASVKSYQTPGIEDFYSGNNEISNMVACGNNDCKRQRFHAEVAYGLDSAALRALSYDEWRQKIYEKSWAKQGHVGFSEKSWRDYQWEQHEKRYEALGKTYGTLVQLSEGADNVPLHLREAKGSIWQVDGSVIFQLDGRRWVPRAVVDTHDQFPPIAFLQ